MIDGDANAPRESLLARRPFLEGVCNLVAVAGEHLTARRLRWGAPPSDALSAETSDRLTELSNVADPPHDLRRIWKWINGRRSARDLYDRLLHGGEIPLETVTEYLRLMEKAGMVEFVVRR